MFYVTYEIGKSGKRERERRHFPWVHNQMSNHSQEPIPRGRIYIPHGNSLPETFHPQMRYIVPEHSKIGPDWTSKIRSIPCLRKSPTLLRQPSTEIWDTNHCSIRPFPHTNRQTRKEWSMHPESDKGIKTHFTGVRESTQSRIFNEDQLEPMKENNPVLSRKRPVHMIDERNGWRMRIPGDKSYSAAEYEPNFFLEGAPVSTSLFSLRKEKSDTFIPLMGKKFKKLNQEEQISREKLADIQSVLELDKWKPALPLVRTELCKKPEEKMKKK